MKSKKNKISRGHARKHKKAKTIVKKDRRKKTKKIIGGFVGDSVLGSARRYVRNAYEGSKQTLRFAKAAYEIKKLYDTKQGQYVLSELGRISYEKNPKKILKKIMNEVVPKNKDNIFFSEDQLEDSHKEIIQQLEASYEEISSEAFNDFTSNRVPLVNFLQNLLALVEDSSYVSTLQNMKNRKNKTQKKKNVSNTDNESEI